MSYILDALNKSDQERKRSRAPGIDVIHPGVTAPRSARWWIPGLLLLVLANGGFLYYWYGIRPTAASSSVTAPPEVSRSTGVPAASGKPNVATVQTISPPAHAAPRGQLITPAGVASEGQSGQAATPSDSVSNPLKIADLPIDVQQQIPAMTFSSHIYSDDAKFRMVNINGKLLHEGDMVATGLRLVRITEEGVVLKFEGYTFEVSVLHDWSFN